MATYHNNTILGLTIGILDFDYRYTEKISQSI